MMVPVADLSSFALPSSEDQLATAKHNQQRMQAAAPIGAPYQDGEAQATFDDAPAAAYLEKKERKWNIRSILPRRSSALTDDEWRLRRRLRYRIYRCVPLIDAGIVGYVTYVYSYLFAYRHLVQLDDGRRRKQGIAFMVVSLYLAVSILTCGVIVYVIGPGFVQKEWGEKFETDLHNRGIAAEVESSIPHKNEAGLDSTNANSATVEDSSTKVVSNSTIGQEKSSSAIQEAFICESDGHPLWCSRCQLLRPDRAHHSSEVDRCVLKMDHYCPWLGSIIGLRNYKPFYLFVAYSLLFATFTFATLTAYTIIYAQEQKHVVAQFVLVDAL